MKFIDIFVFHGLFLNLIIFNCYSFYGSLTFKDIGLHFELFNIVRKRILYAKISVSKLIFKQLTGLSFLWLLCTINST